MFNLIGKTILFKNIGTWETWGKIEGVRTLGNFKFIYMIKTKNDHFDYTVKDLHSYLSRGLLKVKQ